MCFRAEVSFKRLSLAMKMSLCSLDVLHLRFRKYKMNNVLTKLQSEKDEKLMPCNQHDAMTVIH